MSASLSAEMRSMNVGGETFSILGSLLPSAAASVASRKDEGDSKEEEKWKAGNSEHQDEGKHRHKQKDGKQEQNEASGEKAHTRGNERTEQ